VDSMSYCPNGASLLVGGRCGSEAQKRIFKVVIVKRPLTLSGLGLRCRAFRSVLFHRTLRLFVHGSGSDGPFDACDP
jgi:hypothetical protein